MGSVGNTGNSNQLTELQKEALDYYKQDGYYINNILRQGLELDKNEKEFFPIPIHHVTHCLDTVVTKKSIFGSETPIVNDRTCGYLPEPEKDIEWFRQYPCKKSLRTNSKTNTQ